MRPLKTAIGIIFKRPIILLFMGAIALLYCIISSFNPIFTILFGFNTSDIGGLLEGIVSFLRLTINFVTNPDIMLKGTAFLMGFLILASIIAGLVLSGYLYIINNTLDGKLKTKGEFQYGLRKYFLRIAGVTFLVLLLGLIYTGFMAVVSVPAMVVTRSWLAGKTGIFAPAMGLDIVTVLILFFSFMFFRIYIFFWYPAVINSEKRAFTTGKHAADSRFWSVVGTVLLFDLVFLLFEFLSIYADKAMLLQNVEGALPATILFVINWIFKTFFFTAFVAYIFSAFKTYSKA